MIVFVGRSNVGKSTLIFRLTGKYVKRGKRPGVTRKPIELGWRGKTIVDMPGFGFMSGVPKHIQERIKTEIVRFIENNADKIDLAVLVIDGKSALEIIVEADKTRLDEILEEVASLDGVRETITHVVLETF